MKRILEDRGGEKMPYMQRGKRMYRANNVLIMFHTRIKIGRNFRREREGGSSEMDERS